MIVGIFGKDVALRKNALLYCKTLGKVSEYVYTHTFTMEILKQKAEGNSLFGETDIISLENVLSSLDEEKREEVCAICAPSSTIFIFDELEGDASVKKFLEKVSGHFFDASMTSKKKDFPTALCNALKRRDKKVAWVEFQKQKEDAEQLHGAILWQMRALWEDSLSGKVVSYSVKELQQKNKELVVMFHEAHRGNSDLRKEMERWVLKL
jgi:hypothetical protein